MMKSSDENLNRSNDLKRMAMSSSKVLAYMVFIVTLLVWMGWIFNIPFLKQIHPQLPEVQPNTALGLFLAALIILVQHHLRNSAIRNFSVFIISSLIFILGLVTLGEYTFGWDMGIDRIFVTAFPTEMQPFPGRPSPQTSLNFVLLGIALLLMNIKKISPYYFQLSAIAMGANAIIASSGYIFSSQEFYGFPHFLPAIGMAILTSLSFIMLTFSMLGLRPNEGIMTLVVSNTKGGTIFRRSILALILVPSIVGPLSSLGVSMGFYGNNIHLSIVTISLMALWSLLLWFSSIQIYKEEIEAKKYGNKLTQSEKRFRGLLEYAQDAIVSVDKDGRIDFINKQLVEWFGYSSDELLGKPIEVLIPERFHKGHVSMRSNYLNNPTSRPMGAGLKLFGRRKDGSEFPVDIALSPYKSEHKTIVMAIIRDVTTQKKAEAQLRFLMDAGEILSSSLDVSNILPKITHYSVPEIADGCFVGFLNDHMLRTMAITHRSEEKKKEFQKLAEMFQDQLSSTVLKKVIDAGQSILVIDTSKEVINPKYDGPSISEIFLGFGIISFNIIPLLVHGKVQGLMVFTMDLSGRRFMEKDREFYVALAKRIGLALENSALYDETQLAVAAREDILANVYDLKKPLSSVLLNAQLMQDRSTMLPEGEFIRKMAEGIQNLSRQMLQIISDLWDTTALETGKLLLNPGRHNFQDLMRKVQASIQALPKKKEITFSIHGPENQILLHCDEDKICRVMNIFIEHAFESTPSNGKIVVTYGTEDNMAFFKVTDSGTQLAKEEQAHMFDRDLQVQGVLTKELSLAFYLSKGIIEAHDGEIWIEDGTEEVGTTFAFKIPLVVTKNIFQKRPPDPEFPVSHPH